MKIFRFIKFVLLNGNRIIETVENVVALVGELVNEYKKDKTLKS